MGFCIKTVIVNNNKNHKSGFVVFMQLNECCDQSIFML
jgi:hypothetical protein